jgi:hypothetical protein
MKDAELLVKCFDKLGTLFLFSTPKKFSSGMVNVLQHGKFLALKKKDSEVWLSPSGAPITEGEGYPFGMIRLLKLESSKEKESFNIFVSRNVKWSAEVEGKASTEPVQLNQPKEKEEKSTVVREITKMPAKVAPKVKEIVATKTRTEVVSEWLGTRIEGLRNLVKDPTQKIIFESLANRARKSANYQIASNMIVYIQTHLGIEVEKKSIMKFFMELDRLGFGKYTPGPKNRSGWVVPTSMKFVWTNCTAESVCRCGLGLPYPAPLFSSIPTHLVKPSDPKALPVESDEEKEAAVSAVVPEKVTPVEKFITEGIPKKAQVEKEIKLVESAAIVVEPKPPVVVVAPDIAKVVEKPIVIPAPTALFEIVAEGVAIPVKPPVVDTGFDLELSKLLFEEVRTWLAQLSETGARGDMTLAWATYNKLLPIIQQ